MAAQIFFLDTNVFLECRALEELPWKELTNKEPIRLLVALTVIEEIDKRKHGNDRRADRAREASQRLRGMCDAALSIRKADPKVSLEIAPLYFPSAADFPDFDLSRGDNKIIAEIKHFSNGGSPGAPSLLTDDTIATLVAQAHGVHTTRIPAEWFLPREQDQKDKKIREQAEELKFLGDPFAQAELAFYSTENAELGQLSLSLARYRAFEEEEVSELTEAIRTVYPPLQLSASVVQQVRFGGQRLHPVLAQHYNQSDYPQWIEQVREFFVRLPDNLNRNEKSEELILKIDCCGNRPAEDFKVTLKCTGSLLLARPDRFAGDTETESQLILPPPPDPFKAPRQPVRSPSLNLKETEAYPTELYFDPIPRASQDQWTLSMEKFMHETRKELQFRLVANLASKGSSAKLQCIVMAKNFARSVTKTLSCKCKFIKKSARPIANTIIEDSKRK